MGGGSLSTFSFLIFSPRLLAPFSSHRFLNEQVRVPSSERETTPTTPFHSAPVASSPRFKPYRSIFSSYSSLRPGSTSSDSSSSTTSPHTPSAALLSTNSPTSYMFHQFSSSFSLTSQAQPNINSAGLSDLGTQIDLASLRHSVVAEIDPHRRLCQFEIPGGGVCKDSTCPDVHSREFEPSGESLPSFKRVMQTMLRFRGGFPLSPTLLLCSSYPRRCTLAITSDTQVARHLSSYLPNHTEDQVLSTIRDIQRQTLSADRSRATSNLDLSQLVGRTIRSLVDRESGRVGPRMS
ncbi:hypothetical protein BOTBODRAFT_26938 [Botryobasidium botryosum FD-172 SS1]|uniref:Putative zinc-finger domain-containing protein n=1 Tax=Botryobasidium botryosum (strain FD-172 SS1) TaxID=930990 RepID=A0A067N9Y7_BOTB1|nr:hypothetical protein BOTBODRAFT_26938 [Botryobasidium botryosum FD-172 SS1]